MGESIFRIPNLEEAKSLRRFTLLEIKHDSLVKKSVHQGFMTAEELFVGRFVNRCLMLNEPDAVGSMDDPEERLQAWLSKLPEASKAAAKYFKIEPEKAVELFGRSRNVRAHALSLENPNWDKE